MPYEVKRAKLIVDLCERFHCLPSALLAEDASFLRDVHLADIARDVEGGMEDGGE